jgi:DNA repair exonuclease SbcCD ATPase subunit/DNA repair exonuclease SbcCD nuclease subunit
MIATSSTIAWRVRRSVPLLRSFARGSGGNHFPGFSTTPKAPILGEKVLLVNGEVGELIASGRGGWFSVQISRTKEIISVRRTDITSFGDLGLLRESSDKVTIDETPSKEHFPPILQLDPPTIHQDFKRWIIFSDLHVKASSIETCEQVLHEVNECARQRNAGIIFLGDFWHIRGALSVDLLNRVLKSLQKWSQPVIMIPGNHDQVTLGGKIHALEPLRYAFQEKNILMIDEPSICLNALWLPYRRNHHLMKHILTEAWNHSDISAVFCHADVKGAWMNDGMQSREGIDIQLFPPNIPIFSGHFHKPHSVAFSQQSLRYVGSPYQTSLSEADQIKYLYEVSLLDRDSNARAHKWKETDRWPVQIGKRYFKIDYNQLSSKLDGVSSGDTVILQAELKHQREVDVAARELRDKGVEVEVREPQKDKLFIKSLLENSSTLHVPSMLSSSEIVEMQDASANDNNINSNNNNSNNNMLPQESEQFPVISLDMDHMSPVTLFENYMNHVELTQVKPIADNATNLGNSENQEIAAAIQSKVVEEGKQVIERLMHQRQANSEHAGGGTETLGTMNSEHRHLLLDSIKLRNFGPFGGAPVEYPLTKRGLVLLRGQAMDQTGADSNGSGKTTLAMSILWALTGSLDTRLSNDGRSYDVAFDVGPHAPTVAKRYSSSLQRSTAEVSLKGRINGKPFEVIRRKSNKKQELFFFVDGQELTNQAVKDTQAVMDAWLGLDRGVLQRCFFFGQHSHTSQSLLGLTDGKMKEELSPLINIDIWTASSSDCRSREKAIKGELADTNVSLKFATQTEYPRLVEQIQAQETKCRQLEEEFHQLLQSRPTLGGGIVVVGASSSSSSSSSSGDQHRQATFDPKQLQELQDVVAQLESRKEELHRGRLAPLRSELVQIVNNQADSAMVTEEEDNATTVFGAHNATTTIATQLKALQMQASRVKAAQELTATNARRLKDKIETELIPTKNQLQSTMERMLSGDDSIAAEWASIASSSDHDDHDHDDTRRRMDMLRLEDAFREKQEASISHLAALDEQLRVINGTLQRLAVPQPGATAPKGMVDEPTAHAHAHAHAQHLHGQHEDDDGDMCPTCNQTFPMESRVHRQRILRHELQALLSARVEQLRRQRRVQEQFATVKALVELDRQYRSLSKDEDDARRQWTSLTSDLHQGASRERQLQVEIDALQRRERDARQRFQRRVASLQRDIAEAEHEFHGLDADVLAKKQQVQQQQRWFDRWKEQEGRYNVSVHLLEEKGRLARRTVLELQEQLERTQQSVDRLEARRRDLLHRSLILSYLTDFFGPKGIQHYIFQSVIERLEYLANTYLAFLTNDGIRLQLRSDADGEKILKYVLVRHSSDIDAAIAVSSPSSLDLESSTNTNANNNHNHNSSRGKTDDDAIRIPGGFRERGLAQLSGGQWRRVSLALDFAFTELVIRRGLLKCNVLVLDEILTHLDGQGREAVGSVLKAMVDRTSPATTTQPSPQPHPQHDDNDAVVVASDASTSPRVFGGGFETIIVILQDLAANEIEEAFDHIDLVRKDGDVSKVIVDV